jgi:phenylacetic acid degradation protein PaaD
MNNKLVENLFNRDPAIINLGLKLLASEVGSVTIALDIEDRHLNFNGTCHGGIVFSLADAAFGLAANSHGAVAAGISNNINYYAGSKTGDRLTAKSIEITRSRSLASYSVEVLRNDERIVASLTGTVFITKDEHPPVPE